MIEINLLPKELKKKKSAFKMPDVTLVFLPIAAVLVGSLILLQLLLGFIGHVKNRTYVYLDKEWNELLPEKQQIDAIKSEIRKIQRRVGVIDQLMVKRILWSRKMSELSDCMISGVWLTKLSLGEKMPTAYSAAQGSRRPGRGEIEKTIARPMRYLNIEGRASSNYGDETAVVARFIESLKSNEGFYKDFSKVEMELIERKTIKDIEVMDFRISCYFKE